MTKMMIAITIRNTTAILLINIRKKTIYHNMKNHKNVLQQNANSHTHTILFSNIVWTNWTHPGNISYNIDNRPHDPCANYP